MKLQFNGRRNSNKLRSSKSDNPIDSANIQFSGVPQSICRDKIHSINRKRDGQSTMLSRVASSVASSPSSSTVRTETSKTTNIPHCSTPPRKIESLGSGSFGRDGIVEEFLRGPVGVIQSTKNAMSSPPSHKSQLAEAMCYNDGVDNGTKEDISRPKCSREKESVIIPRNACTATKKEVAMRLENELTLVNKARKEATNAVVTFLRHSSSFLRVSDLQIDTRLVAFDATTSTVASSVAESDEEASEYRTQSCSEDLGLPNYHFVASDPPPGYPVEHNELWVSLDNGAGSHSPLAAAAVTALEEFGREVVCFNKEMWIPDRATEKLLLKSKDHWQACTFDQEGPCPQVQCCPDKDSILIWSGKIVHGFYGNDVPLVRASGIIDMPPEKLLNLLLDSSRVKEYNEISLGRTDLLVLQSEMDDADNVFGGVTKVVQSQSRPPMLRKTMQFTSLIHARPLVDGSGYILVTRAVTAASENGHSSANGVLVSEILNGVNIIKHVEGNPSQCLFVAVNHVRSPLLPMMIAKRIGLQAVVNYIQDLRKCCT